MQGFLFKYAFWVLSIPESRDRMSHLYVNINATIDINTMFHSWRIYSHWYHRIEQMYEDTCKWNQQCVMNWINLIVDIQLVIIDFIFKVTNLNGVILLFWFNDLFDSFFKMHKEKEFGNSWQNIFLMINAAVFEKTSINSDENIYVIFINKRDNQLIFNEWTIKKSGSLRLRLIKYDGELDDERLNFWIITSSV